MTKLKRIAAAAAAVMAMATAPAMADLKIGVLTTDSGPAGLFGPSTRNSAELAAKWINENGGILGQQIVLVPGDVGVPPAEATQTAVRLWRGEKVDAFIGAHDSAVREALVGRFNGQVPLVYTTLYEGNACASGLYVTGETPSQLLAPVIPWLARERGATKWYVIGHDYNWPRKTSELAHGYIASAGGEVVGEEFVPFSVTEFDSSLQRIKASGANAVLVLLVGGGSVSFNVAYAGFGLDEQAIRLGPIIEENTLAGIGAANSKGIYSSAGYFEAVDTEAANGFRAAYGEGLGPPEAPVNPLGGSAYQGLVFLHAPAERAGRREVAPPEPAAEGTTFDSPRGQGIMHGRHVAQNIYLAEADGAKYRVIQSFEKVPSTEACP